MDRMWLTRSDRIHTVTRGAAAGLMAAIEFADSQRTTKVVAGLLREGVLAYPGGIHDNVICFTPPLTITQEQVAYCMEALARVVQSN